MNNNSVRSQRFYSIRLHIWTRIAQARARWKDARRHPDKVLWESRRRVAAIVFLVLTGGMLAWNFNVEQISWNNGLGMDGSKYGRVAKKWPKLMEKPDERWIGRILPSTVVYGGLIGYKAATSDKVEPLLWQGDFGKCWRDFGCKHTDKEVIAGFRVWNSVMLGATGALWILLAGHLRWAPGVALVGLLGLFLNFQVMKFGSFYPVLTDITAIFLGMLMVYGYLLKRLILVSLAMVLGAFTWEQSLYYGVILCLLPPFLVFRFDTNDEGFTSTRVVAAAGIGLGLGAVAWLAPEPFDWGSNFITLGQVLVIGYLGLAAYFLIGRREMLAPIEWLKVGKGNGRRWAVWAITGLVLFFGLRYFRDAVTAFKSGGTTDVFSAFAVLFNRGAAPFSFVIPYPMVFGLLYVIAVLRFKAVATTIRELGPGAVALTALAVVSTLDYEARHWVMLLPALVVVVVMSLEGARFTRRFWLIFSGLSVWMSFFWWKIGPFVERSKFAYPDFKYYMFTRPMHYDWVPGLFGLILVLLGICFWYLLRHEVSWRPAERERFR